MSKLRTLVVSGLAASSLVVTFGVAVSNAAPDLGLPQDNVSKGVVSSGAAQIYIPADVATKMSARGVPGRGWIRSVTSFVPSDNSYIGGPNFDSRTINLWTAANAAGL